MDFDSFGALGKDFSEMAKKTPAASAFAVKHGAEAIAQAAKSKFGGYQDGWPQLSPFTQADRLHQGFTANDPLFRSGGLRDSVKVHAEGDSAFIGVTVGETTLTTTGLDGSSRSVDAALVMAVQEYGNERVPKRPVFGTVIHDDLDRISDSVAIETLARIGLTEAEGAPPKR